MSGRLRRMATPDGHEDEVLRSEMDRYARDLFKELRRCAKAQGDVDWTVFLLHARRSLEIVVRILKARQGQPLPDEAQGNDKTLDAWIRQLADSGVLSQAMRDTFLILKGRGAIGTHYRGRAAEDEKLAADSARLELRNVIVFLVERSPAADHLETRKVAYFELLELMEQQASPRSLSASFPTQLAAQGRPSSLPPPASTLDPVPAALEDTASHPIAPVEPLVAQTVVEEEPATPAAVEEDPEAAPETEPEPAPQDEGSPPPPRRSRTGRLVLAAVALLGLAGLGSLLGVGGALAFFGLRSGGADGVARQPAQLGPAPGDAPDGPPDDAVADLVPRIAPEVEAAVPLRCPRPGMVLVPATQLSLEVPRRLRTGGGVADMELPAFCIDAEPVARTDFRVWEAEAGSAYPDSEVDPCTWQTAGILQDAVRCVRWPDATRYCEDLEEPGARLPRLAEWEAFQRQPEGAQALSGTQEEWAHEADLHEALGQEEARRGPSGDGLGLARPSSTTRPPEDTKLQWRWSVHEARHLDPSMGFRCAADAVPARSTRAAQ